ncbi:MAG TPA: alanine racemase [Actinobacteria bacterium]|nr:alanine racemase [Actinomycetota bacterium]
MIRPVWAEIDLSAIRDNIRNTQDILPEKTRLMAVVKSNAYGHGLIPVAKTVVEAGADRLGVASIEEAIELRTAGLQVPIQILSEPPASASVAIIEHNLIPTVYSLDLPKALSVAARKKGTTAKIHLKIDTGMHRVGILPERAGELYKTISELEGLFIEGVFTHFACADRPADPYTQKQLRAFLELKKILLQIPIWHAANSAGAFFFPQTHLDMVRIGIAMYGLQPSADQVLPQLRPALSLKTKIAFTQDLQAGQSVSYGLTFTAQHPTKIAVLPIGYGDGFSRLLSNQGIVLIAGQRVNIIGRVCMDQSMVDLDGVEATLGGEAVLIGSQGSQRITAEEMAAMIGTINYEIVCLINNRVARVYKNS